MAANRHQSTRVRPARQPYSPTAAFWYRLGAEAERCRSVPVQVNALALARRVAELERKVEVRDGELALFDEEPLRLNHPDDLWGE